MVANPLPAPPLSLTCARVSLRGLNANFVTDLILTAGDESIDSIWCGDGLQDLAIVDPDDVVASDCEFIWVRDPES